VDSATTPAISNYIECRLPLPAALVCRPPALSCATTTATNRAFAQQGRGATAGRAKTFTAGSFLNDKNPASGAALGREVTMKSPLVIVLVAVVLVAVSTLAVMNQACKSSQHAWCAPMSPVIGRTVTVEVQRRSRVAKEEPPAKDVTPVVSTAKADSKKSKHYKPKVWPVPPTTTVMGTH
jgi:hypothetical protein